MMQLSAPVAARLLLIAKMRVAAKRDETPIHKAADVHLAPMTLALRAAFGVARKALGKNANIDSCVSTLHAALLKVLPPVLLKTLAAGGEVGLASVKKLRGAELRTLKPQEPGKPHDVKPPFSLAFNVSDPAAAKWAREHTSKIADDISQTSKDAIDEAIAKAMEDGDLDAAYDDILAAVGDEARAEMIARTESMTAANEGQRQGWDQAVDAGMLSGNEQVQWIATSGCCDDCDDLDGEVRDLDGEYPGDGEDGPPLHPNCRCTEGIVA